MSIVILHKIRYFFTVWAVLSSKNAVLGSENAVLGSGLAVVGLGQLSVNEPVCRVGYIYD